MSNTPQNIIIQSSSLERLDPEHVRLKFIATAVDSENDCLPGVELALLVNRKKIHTLISDADGLLEVNQVLKLQEGETISLQLQEVTSGVKSKVKMLVDLGKRQEEETSTIETEITTEIPIIIEKKDALEQLLEIAIAEIRINPGSFKDKRYDIHRGRKDFAMEAVRLNPFNYEHIGTGLKADKDLIQMALSGNFDTVLLMNKKTLLEEAILSKLKKMPGLFTKCITNSMRDITPEGYNYILIITNDSENINFIHSNGYTLFGMTLRFCQFNLDHIKLFLAHPDIDLEAGTSGGTIRSFLKERGII